MCNHRYQLPELSPPLLVWTLLCPARREMKFARILRKNKNIKGDHSRATSSRRAGGTNVDTPHSSCALYREEINEDDDVDDDDDDDDDDTSDSSSSGWNGGESRIERTTTSIPGGDEMRERASQCGGRDAKYHATRAAVTSEESARSCEGASSSASVGLRSMTSSKQSRGKGDNRGDKRRRWGPIASPNNDMPTNATLVSSWDVPSSDERYLPGKKDVLDDLINTLRVGLCSGGTGTCSSILRDYLFCVDLSMVPACVDEKTAPCNWRENAATGPVEVAALPLNRNPRQYYQVQGGQRPVARQMNLSHHPRVAAMKSDPCTGAIIRGYVYDPNWRDAVLDTMVTTAPNAMKMGGPTVASSQYQGTFPYLSGYPPPCVTPFSAAYCGPMSQNAYRAQNTPMF